MSDSEESKKEVTIGLFDVVFREYYYGRTLFWVENYYKNQEDYLLKNMWLAVDYKHVYVIDPATMRWVKRFDLKKFNFYHLPNGIMIGKCYDKAVRFTTSASYAIYMLI